MKIYPAEWLQIPKEERLLCIRWTVSENLQKQRKKSISSKRKNGLFRS